MKFKNVFKSKAAKITGGIFVTLFVIGAISGPPEQQKVEAITLTSTVEKVDINNEQTFTYTVEPKNIKLTKENIIIEDSGVLEIKDIDKTSITLKTTNKTGNTSFYITANDVNSNNIHLTVVDIKKEEEARLNEEKRIANEAKIQEEQRIAQENARIQEEQRLAQENARIQEEQRLAQENARIQEEQNRANAQAPSNTTPNSATVYITKTGTKYHSHPNCGNSKTAYAGTLDEALSRGLTPCQTCY